MVVAAARGWACIVWKLHSAVYEMNILQLHFSALVADSKLHKRPAEPAKSIPVGLVLHRVLFYTRLLLLAV